MMKKQMKMFQKSLGDKDKKCLHYGHSINLKNENEEKKDIPSNIINNVSLADENLTNKEYIQKTFSYYNKKGVIRYWKKKTAGQKIDIDLL